jgi:hypothetical protein
VVDEDAADAAPSPSSPRRRRSPLIDVAVALFGGYLLVTMFGDVRYFLQGSTPTDLGDAAQLVESGKLGDGLREQYVTLRGTPDVQHAARAKLGEKTIGYLRVVEGGGSLFAAVPRSPDKPTGNQFEGQFTGRMRRLSDVRMYAWIEQYFDGERIVETHDLTKDQLLAALDAGKLRAGDQISLSVDQPDARVQLGRNSFRNLAAAEAAVKALGVPYYAPAEQPSAAFYTFVARIAPDQRAAAQAALTAAGEPASPEQADKPDPRVGALVVPFFTTYLVPAAELKREADKLGFPLGDDDTSPGYVLADGQLIPRPLQDGRLQIEPAQLRAAGRLQPVRVDPDGYIILVDERPMDQWPTLALWLVVLAVVGWNLASLAVWWRRRQA